MASAICIQAASIPLTAWKNIGRIGAGISISNRYLDAPKPVYQELLKLVQGKDYFVLTTNVDHCFQKAGFDKQRLFYTQGDYGLWQCSRPCHQKTYDNETIVKKMVAEQRIEKSPAN